MEGEEGEGRGAANDFIGSGGRVGWAVGSALPPLCVLCDVALALCADDGAGVGGEVRAEVEKTPGAGGEGERGMGGGAKSTSRRHSALGYGRSRHCEVRELGECKKPRKTLPLRYWWRHCVTRHEQTSVMGDVNNNNHVNNLYVQQRYNSVRAGSAVKECGEVEGGHCWSAVPLPTVPASST